MGKAIQAYSQSRLDAFPSVLEEPHAPVYAERPLHHGPPEEALACLGNLDWSFTHEDTRFLGHDLHPYPAKFIPQLPGTFISNLSSRGEVVFDPFGGSGTTALEAIRLGRRAISLDANPVAALIGRVKTARIGGEATSELHKLHAALRAFLEGLSVTALDLIGKYSRFAPTIANREKWFSDEAFGELSHIKARIAGLQSEVGKDVADLALSRTVLAASFQDSETRYKSVPRAVELGESTRKYVKEFELVMRSVARNAAATRYGISQFITGDIRSVAEDTVAHESVDLVMTSPPYGNATDYHLYHRFRLLWLGHDPISLGKVEIGSHLKHQRESSSFASYFADLLRSLESIERVLRPGRYAVLVIGDSLYEGKTYSTAQLAAKKAAEYGFGKIAVIDRKIHLTKRSFTAAGRRASTESILVLQKTPRRTLFALAPPPYRLWPYEEALREREIRTAACESSKVNTARRVALDVAQLHRAKTLVFTHQLLDANARPQPTWQSILENGTASAPSARKDPKYVTHGLHPYKGKFYPQLAKALLNQANLPLGATILDPFCGSGTTLLEGHLNGYSTYGCDLHPLAAHISAAKTAILDVEPDVFTEAVAALLDAIASAPSRMPRSLSEFEPQCHDEIGRWFASSVAFKLNWLLAQIRATSDGVIRKFLEVVVSSIVREVSHQEPSDLRIRYRTRKLEDADVISLFSDQLQLQFSRIERFWRIRGYSPTPFYKCSVVAGDNRRAETYGALGLQDEMVDLVLTSSPYAMALPYIDTDRLSLLTLFGLDSSLRRPLEHSLIGSREISNGSRDALDASIQQSSNLPISAISFLRGLQDRVLSTSDAGFRKRNMPALVCRFLEDMNKATEQIHRLLKPSGLALIVIGDSKMTLDSMEVRIPTTDLVDDIAAAHQLKKIERIDISVTTENLLHIKNAITENVVLAFRKPG